MQNRPRLSRLVGSLILLAFVFGTGIWYRMGTLTDTDMPSGVEALSAPASMRSMESVTAADTSLESDLRAADPNSANADLEALEKELR